MNNRISRIKNNVQDKNSEAWLKLCKYIDKVYDENIEEFSPLEELGYELYSQIHTLPETISKLKNVKKIWLYGSKLKRIPPEIGEMESLEYFDPYTSYDLHWFPYEIINCKKLKSSRVSTRALYGNYKNRMAFPLLEHNPVRYENALIQCSICKKEMKHEETNQLWITLRIGTGTLPLLANLCSKKCEQKLPESPKGYVQNPHKGGSGLKQPSEEEWEQANIVKIPSEETQNQNQNNKYGIPKLLKLVRKIWER